MRVIGPTSVIHAQCPSLAPPNCRCTRVRAAMKHSGKAWFAPKIPRWTIDFYITGPRMMSQIYTESTTAETATGRMKTCRNTTRCMSTKPRHVRKLSNRRSRPRSPLFVAPNNERIRKPVTSLGNLSLCCLVWSVRVRPVGPIVALRVRRRQPRNRTFPSSRRLKMMIARTSATFATRSSSER